MEDGGVLEILFRWLDGVMKKGWRESFVHSEHTVMRRVFDGGEGLINGGMVERSKDRGGLVALDCGLDWADVGGDTLAVGMLLESELIDRLCCFRLCCCGEE